MIGFSRAQAGAALDLGWSRDQILLVHERLREREIGVTAVRDWGLLADDYLIIYRDHDPSLLTQTHPSVEAKAYTDGSGTTKNKESGIGVYIEDGGQRLLIAENVGLGTNNRAELLAVWRAVRQFECADKLIHIYSDSAYAIGACTESWQPNANANLIRCMREDLAWREGHVFIEHVRGHSGNEGNEIADRLARVGRTIVKKVSVFAGVDPWPSTSPQSR